ncbi:oplophorus-luciferin 2-monooxygenase non-catalytic subunit-like [Penaeus monodon]|uniref:oplophorus-luciferin 2-monooxygenase non-catalytic subunit-like n=1 Tax=Penaeus monodon TaxID=6687 RepID=UPI0018A6FEB1|nr:oplophorus-luciferin 2-monooxygenase non-catalytic subunit-like [Penaeus monodon]XP_037794366.1 oplophorus-luciferin 2-monooxygenase non-catalytic subunit-like [Penaeus monodon]
MLKGRSFLLLLLLVTFCQGSDVAGLKTPRFRNRAEESGSIFRKLPCPNPEDIFPCTCTADEDNRMDMDCSYIEGEEQLERVFSSTFPFSTFRNFTVVDNVFLKTLGNQSLGIASFTGVYIMNSVLEVVESRALSNSFSTAQVINMQKNVISSFPFETLPSFTSLLELDVSYNKLPFPALVSETLLVLDFSHNLVANVSSEAFAALPDISEIKLGGNQISAVPTGTFAGHRNLYHVNLESNSLTYLPEGAIQLTSSSSGTVLLRSNQIADVAVNSITDVSGGKVDISNNTLTALKEDVFRPILAEDTALDAKDNPLTCGCDIAWLIRDAPLLELVGEGAACFDGELLADLDPGMFDDLGCP